VKHLVEMMGQSHQQGVGFRSVTEAIDTGTASGRFFFHVIVSLAEMERELTMSAPAQAWRPHENWAAKAAAKPQTPDDRQQIRSAKKLLASGVPPRDVAGNLGVSVPTLYRWIPASAHP